MIACTCQCLNMIAFIELRNIKHLQNIQIKIPEISAYDALRDRHVILQFICSSSN